MKKAKRQNKRYVFALDFQKFNKGDFVSDDISESFLRMLINKRIVLEASEEVVGKLMAEIDLKNKKIEEEKRLLAEKELIKENRIKVLKNKTLLFSSRVSKELLLVKEINQNEIIEKILCLTDEKNIKIKEGPSKITKIGDYNYKIIIDDEYETNIVVSVKEANIKGQTKRMGLKSAFVKDDNIILTSFGKGNESNIEYKISDNVALQVSNNPSFNVENVTDASVYLMKDKLNGLIDKPNYSKDCGIGNIKLDYLERKPVLERKYFGREFNDNIHIQLIYNIMDIKKILGLYVEDINYVICSLGRQENVYDLMGTSKYKMSYDVFRSELNFKNYQKFDEFFKKAKDYFLYYPQVLEKDFFRKEKIDESKKDLYTIIRILSMCRQFVKHNNDENFDILQIDSINEPFMKEINEKINRVYKNGFDKLHNNFAKNSEKNIYLILKSLSLEPTIENIEQVLNNLYKISICKENINLGFDFKKVKEKLIEKACLDIKLEDKGMYNQVISYLIYDNLNEDYIDDVVCKLRETSTNEEKELIYNRFVNKLYEHTSLNKLLSKKLLQSISEVKLNKNSASYFPNIDLNEIFKKIVVPSQTLFDKLIYFLTCFMDAKETNMLLVSLINKLQNIKGLVKIIKKIYNQDTLNIVSEYSMFEEEEVNDYIDKLNLVMNLTKLQKNINKISKSKETTKNSEKTNNKAMFYDAYRLFGAESEELSDIHEKVYLSKGRKNNRKQSLRNFIISKIINSNKFRYVVQYSNPEEVSSLLKNDKIIEYVLNEIPDEKINKHCEQAKIQANDKSKKILELKEKLQKLNIKYIIDKYDSDEDYISILTGLYITIIYLVIKSLVRINSYYSIAFSCIERDKSLYGYSDIENIDLDLVNIFIEKGKFKNRTNNWILNNSEIFNNVFKLPIPKSSINDVYRACFRNKVVHLSALTNFKVYVSNFKQDQKLPMNSYFELYHYIIQRLFIDEYDKKTSKVREKSTVVEKWKYAVDKYQTYSKDMLHIICMPFVYNLARYKNLTIEDIFYDLFKDKVKLK